MKYPFIGTGVALVTPFKNDLSVDTKSLHSIVDYVINQGVNFLVALGTTSEAPTLNQNEKDLVLDTILEAADNRVPIVLGVGGNNTYEVVRQLETKSMEGISGILSVVPYYNKPNQQGLFEHFDTIAKASPRPIILYNVPGRSGANLKASTTIHLAEEHKNIIGIKEASGDFLQIMDILKDKPSHFEVISGDDALTLPLMALGAVGVISVTANALTQQFSDMVRLLNENNTVEARKIHFSMLKMYELLFSEGNPAGIKALMSLMGLCKEFHRLPLVPVTKSTKERIEVESKYFINL
ncbi:MAG: 4-hydroxy-tetrahydrodipicolinate synthase [Bacteroidetes bacterium HGW-Bacteroidetes-1]|jgi:4-hydroxy-tetrahydrodipicolinate synthase|nr:MAG: 4-hydroxy-tetrahydrodipicolinate synthase [Bacteroidetes bacterium HGW-Bacteroidetes-1]